MTDKARELLERCLRRFYKSGYECSQLVEDIENFLSTPEPTQDEPVDISDKSEPTVAAILPNGVAVSNVYEAYEAGLKEVRLQDDEPIGVVEIIDTDEDGDAYAWVGLYQSVNLGDLLYLHPAPRPEFVRLSEEEVNSLTYAPYEPYELICAVENMLERKNRER